MASAYDGAVPVESTENPVRYMDVKALKLSENPEFQSRYSPILLEEYKDLPNAVSVCAISRDGKYCAFYTSRYTNPSFGREKECKIFVLDIDSRVKTELFSFKYSDGGVSQICFSNCSKYLVCNLFNSVLVLNIKTCKVVFRKYTKDDYCVSALVIGAYSSRVAFAAIKTRFTTIGYDDEEEEEEEATDSFFVYDAPNILGIDKAEKKLFVCPRLTHTVHISGDASILGCLSVPIESSNPFKGSNGIARQFTAFDITSMREISSFVVPVNTHTVSMTPFGTRMINHDTSSCFCYLWDVLTGTRLMRIPNLLYPSIIFTPDLKFYIETGLNNIYTYETATSRLVSRESISESMKGIHNTSTFVSDDFGRAVLIVSGKLTIISPKIGMLNRAVTVALCQSKRNLYIPVELLRLIVDKFV